MLRIAIANQKGGVGKTTTAINLSCALAFMDKKVLLVDMDSQAHATVGLGVQPEVTIYEVLLEGVPAEKALVSPVKNLWLLPSSIQLAGGAVEMVYLPKREFLLKRALEGLKGKFDVIFVDCPPSLGLLTVNALTFAEGVLIPLQCEFLAMEGLGKLVDTIKRVRKSFNPDLKIDGVLLTMYDPRTKLSQEVVAEVRKHLGERVYNTLIPRNVALAEAPSYGKPVFLYDSSSRGAKAYMELAKEFVERHSL